MIHSLNPRKFCQRRNKVQAEKLDRKEILGNFVNEEIKFKIKNDEEEEYVDENEEEEK